MPDSAFLHAKGIFTGLNNDTYYYYEFINYNVTTVHNNTCIVNIIDGKTYEDKQN